MWRSKTTRMKIIKWLPRLSESFEVITFPSEISPIINKMTFVPISIATKKWRKHLHRAHWMSPHVYKVSSFLHWFLQYLHLQRPFLPISENYSFFFIFNSFFVTRYYREHNVPLRLQTCSLRFLINTIELWRWRKSKTLHLFDKFSCKFPVTPIYTSLNSKTITRSAQLYTVFLCFAEKC